MPLIYQKRGAYAPSKYISDEINIVCFCHWLKKLSWERGGQTSKLVTLVIIRYSAPSCLLCPRGRIFFRRAEKFSCWKYFCSPLKMESAPDKKMKNIFCYRISIPWLCFYSKYFETFTTYFKACFFWGRNVDAKSICGRNSTTLALWIY